MNRNNYISVLRNALIFLLTLFAATFYMVEKLMIFIHIQLAVIGIIVLMYAFASKSVPSISRIGRTIFFSMIGMWCCFLLSVYINNEWYEGGLQALNAKIWLIAMPSIFILIPTLNRNEYTCIFIGFVSSIFVLSTITIVFFFLVKTDILSGIPIYYDSLIDATFIPFSIYHHTVCVYLVFCLIILHFIYTKWNSLLTRFLRISMFILSFCIIIYIVLISARIGFITLGAILFLYGLKYLSGLNISLSRKFLLLTFGILFLTFILWLSPTAKNRIIVTYQELNTSLNNGGNHMENISARLLAYKVATSLLKKHPYTGVSFSKENNTYMKEYSDTYGIKPDNHPFPGSPLKPHTQFYRYLVIMGIPTGILLFLLYLLPFLAPFKITGFDFKVFYFVFTLYTLTDFPFDLKEVFYMYCFMIPLWAHIEQSSKREFVTSNQY